MSSPSFRRRTLVRKESYRQFSRRPAGVADAAGEQLVAMLDFRRKFADPSYYGRMSIRHHSSLAVAWAAR